MGNNETNVNEIHIPNISSQMNKVAESSSSYSLSLVSSINNCSIKIFNQGDSDEEGSESDEDDNLDDTEEVAEKDDSESEDEDDNKEKEVDKKESVSSLIHRKMLCHFLLIKKMIVIWQLKRVNSREQLQLRGSLRGL